MPSEHMTIAFVWQRKSIKVSEQNEDQNMPVRDNNVLSGKKDRRMQDGDNNLVAKAAWWIGCLSAPGAERYRLVPGKKQFTLEMEGSVSWKGLRCIQTGLIVGSAEKRFEPSIQLALSICDKDKLPYVNLSSEEQDVIRYLKGETLQDVTVLNEGMLKQTENYVLVCVDGLH